MESYPRPDFYRRNQPWKSLNGPWSFLFDDQNTGLEQEWHIDGLPLKTDSSERREILVPYAFQTPASGINLQEAHEVIWYERNIPDIRIDKDKSSTSTTRLLLRFGAVDYECTVWLNGVLYTEHRGGQISFDIDVTDAFSQTQEHDQVRLTLRVRDSPTDLTQPRGKQYWGPVPESIFYTPTSGIWQSVWLEVVPAVRILDSLGGTVLDGSDPGSGKIKATISIEMSGADVSGVTARVTVSFSEIKLGIGEAGIAGGLAGVDVDVRDHRGQISPERLLDVHAAWRDGVVLWAPEHPFLYDVVIEILDVNGNVLDQVTTAVGMRSISWDNGDGTFRLNGQPYFQTLVLDQGYWPETGLTPPSPEALKADIEMSKKLGFNGCRKHQKVEDPAFLYWADRLGYLVWGEIGNAYEFSDEYVDRFNSEWAQVVKRDRNHPSVVVWTPVNESWGYKNLKNNTEEREHIRYLCSLTKELDPTRPINDNCGWEHIQTDLTTYHDYSDSTELAKMCSTMEGGILARKLNGEMFTDPISSDSTTLDPGSEHKPGAPVICSEFGGVNIAPAYDTEQGSRDWGYTTAADPNDLLDRLEKLVMAVVKGGHTCGFVYTQLSDIEQEVNGIYSYDRREKVPAERVKAIMDSARKYYYENVVPAA
ncbi:glycoside hydrolase superfamily [Aspergillus karnatakaensis]|uniref:glycoside hydrolase family 2 protein n=1 Tax=Aspergillus karnatakaensis TaxID=1810916 RepID=UPI003CCDC315